MFTFADPTFALDRQRALLDEARRERLAMVARASARATAGDGPVRDPASAVRLGLSFVHRLGRPSSAGR